MPAIWIKLEISWTAANVKVLSLPVGSVALESWVRAQSWAWPLTPTTFWVGGFSTPGGRKAAWPRGKAPSWSDWPWTAPSTWSNMTALIACTELSSSKTAGCPTYRCCLRKSVSGRTTWRIGPFLVFSCKVLFISYYCLLSSECLQRSEIWLLLIDWVCHLMLTWV